MEELEDVGHDLAEVPERIPGDRPELGRTLLPAEGRPEVGQGDPAVAAVETEGERPERPAERQAPGTGEDEEEGLQDHERQVFGPGSSCPVSLAGGRFLEAGLDELVESGFDIEPDPEGMEGEAFEGGSGGSDLDRVLFGRDDGLGPGRGERSGRSFRGKPPGSGSGREKKARPRTSAPSSRRRSKNLDGSAIPQNARTLLPRNESGGVISPFRKTDESSRRRPVLEDRGAGERSLQPFLQSPVAPSP